MIPELALGIALCSVLISAANLVALVRLQGRNRDLVETADQRVRKLEKQLTAATAGAVGIGQRIVVLEQRLNALASSREDHDLAGDQHAYTQAVQMLDQGADVDTVVASCGLSHSEAQLMALVRKQTAGKPATRPNTKTRERG